MSAQEVSIAIPQPHPGQARIDASPKRHKIVRCARRWGKSKYSIMRGIRCAVNGGKVGMFFPSNKYATESFRELVRRLKPITEMPGGRVSLQENRIELPNGGVIEVWSVDSNEDPARGRDYDLAIIDEAGLISNLNTIFRGAIEPTLIDRDGSALLLGTPKGSRTPFNVMFSEVSAGDDAEWGAFTGHTVDNITIPDVVNKVERARRRAEKHGTMALFRQEYLGEVVDDGANPIGLQAIAAAIAPASTEPVVAWGVDLAKAIDYTVAIGFDAWGRWVAVHRFQQDWGATKKKLLEICGTETPVVMDATGVGSPIVADLDAMGMQVSPFVFSRKSRGLLIEELISAIHNKQMTVPAGFVQGELESLGVDYNNETGFTRYEVPDGMHDDGMMALAMAWRCYQYSAENPHWPIPRNDAPWSPGVDEAVMLEADDAFATLGGGW